MPYFDGGIVAGMRPRSQKMPAISFQQWLLAVLQSLVACRMPLQRPVSLSDPTNSSQLVETQWVSCSLVTVKGWTPTQREEEELASDTTASCLVSRRTSIPSRTIKPISGGSLLSSAYILGYESR